MSAWTAEQLFEASYIPEPNSGCWLWLGGMSSRGYGTFIGSAYAHRVSHEMHTGPIPDGLEIDHTCGVRACVNPNHLRLVTHAENLRSRKGKYRFSYITGKTCKVLTRNRTTSHCKNGHSFAGDNLITRPNGHRICRECQRVCRRKAYHEGKFGREYYVRRRACVRESQSKASPISTTSPR